MRLVTGKSVNIPVITVGNDATESLFDSEAIKKNHGETSSVHDEVMRR